MMRYCSWKRVSESAFRTTRVQTYMHSDILAHTCSYVNPQTYTPRRRGVLRQPWQTYKQTNKNRQSDWQLGSLFNQGLCIFTIAVVLTDESCSQFTPLFYFLILILIVLFFIIFLFVIYFLLQIIIIFYYYFIYLFYFNEKEISAPLRFCPTKWIPSMYAFVLRSCVNIRIHVCLVSWLLLKEYLWITNPCRTCCLLCYREFNGRV